MVKSVFKIQKTIPRLFVIKEFPRSFIFGLSFSRPWLPSPKTRLLFTTLSCRRSGTLSLSLSDWFPWICLKLVTESRSIKQALDDFNSGKDSGSGLSNLLSDCIAAFKDNVHYRDDIRFLKIWFLYVFPSTPNCTIFHGFCFHVSLSMSLMPQVVYAMFTSSIQLIGLCLWVL